MAKYHVVTLIGLLLCLSVSKCQSLSLTFDLAWSPSNTIATDWYNGISSSGGDYATIYTPNLGGNPFDVTVPTYVSYGYAVQQELPGTHPTESFNYQSGSPASSTSALLNFDVYVSGNPAGKHNFLVEGGIGGNISTTASSAYYQATGILDTTTNTLYTSTYTNGFGTFLSATPVIDGNSLIISVRNQKMLAPVSNQQGDSIDGYVDVNVPEPGSMGMLLGSGISAFLFAFQRRRRMQ